MMVALAFSAVLFTGGRSSRMGRDKALLELEGQPLWQRQVALLRSLQPSEILISGSAEAFPGQNLGDCIVMPDLVSGLGPLGGLDTVLHHACCDQVLILAVDLPRMRPEVLARLLEHAIESGRGVVPRGVRGLEPLAAVYPRTCQPLISMALAAGERSMHAFVRQALGQQQLVEWTLDAADEDAFLNVNTAAEWQALVAINRLTSS